MILPVVKIPNKILLQKAKKVVKFDSKFLKLIKNMSDTLIASKNPEGVGLAAPQVGISIRLFVTRPTKRSKVRSYINPIILKVDRIDSSKSEKKGTYTLEGCLSLDRIWSPITRSLKIHLQYQTFDKKMHIEWFEGFKATIMQHEIDHLNGILFTKRAVEQHSLVYEERNGKLEEIRI